MAGPEDTGVKKSLGDVVEQLQVLNDTMDKMAAKAGETGKTRIKQGNLAKLFNFLRLRATKKAAAARLAALNKLQDLNLEQAIYDKEHQKIDEEDALTSLTQDKSSDAAQEEGDTQLRTEITQQSEYLDDIEKNQEEMTAAIRDQTKAEIEQLEVLTDITSAATDQLTETTKQTEQLDNLEAITSVAATDQLAETTKQTEQTEQLADIIAEQPQAIADAIKGQIEIEGPEALEPVEVKIEGPETLEPVEVKIEGPETLEPVEPVELKVESGEPEEQSPVQVEGIESLDDIPTELVSIHSDILAISGMMDQQLSIADQTLDVLKTESSDPNTSILQSIKLTGENSLKVLANMLNLQLDDSAAAAEMAREAARAGMGGGGEGVPDGKAEEAKAGGFFSRMGKSIMNPIGAMGKGMKSMGKGIQGFLTGLAKGLAAFANPMVIVGVAVMAISLPIFAAGLAAAFKVFEMIAGEGKALEMITGIIESLGGVIGDILMKVLIGFGEMIKRMGPLITLFFDGIATVVKALTPIITALFQTIKDIITDPVLNETIRAVLKTVEVLIVEIGKVIKVVGDVVIKAIEAIEKIIDSVGKTITGVIDGIANVITAIGNTIEKILGAVGDTVEQILDSIVGGLERLGKVDVANLFGVALALYALAGALVVFAVGAAVAGGVMPSKKDLEGIAGSIDVFSTLNAENLHGVGKALKALGEGLGVFAVGGAQAAVMNLFAGEDLFVKIAAQVGTLGKIDGKNLPLVGTGMEALGKGLGSFAEGGAAAGVASLFTSDKLFEKIAADVGILGKIDGKNLPLVGTGMIALGDGLKTFASGGAAAAVASLFTSEDLFKNIARDVGAIAGLDVKGERLVQLGIGIEGIGAGVAAFGKGQAVGAIGGVMSALGSFFGADSPIDQIVKLAGNTSIDAKRLKELGEGIGPLGEGLAGFSGLDMGGGFFGGNDLDDFIKMIVKIGDSKAPINTDQIKKVAAGIKPLGEAMSGFGGVDMENLDDIDKFFGALNSKSIGKMASTAELTAAAAGIEPLAKSMKAFSGIDMDAITGGWGEDNLGKFFEGIGSAINEIEDPGKLTAVASGVSVLGTAMQSFKGLESDNMDFTAFFESLQIGDPERMKKNLELLGWTGDGQSNISGSKLANLQVEAAGVASAAATFITTTTTSQQINQNTALALPAADIKAGNGESALPGTT